MEQVSKKEQARQVYQSMIVDNKHPVRKDVIKRFMEECQLTQAGASLYQHNFKSGKWAVNVIEPAVVEPVVQQVEEVVHCGDLTSEMHDPNFFEEIECEDADQLDRLTGTF